MRAIAGMAQRPVATSPSRGMVAALLVRCLLLVSTVLSSGCAGHSHSAGVVFAPDSTSFAFVRATLVDWPLPPEMPTMRSTVFVRWCSTASFRDCRELEVGVFGSRHGSFVADRFAVAFSPGSRYLAVRGPSALDVVDLATGTSRRLSVAGELTTSMSWLGDEDLGVVSRIHVRGESDTTADRLVWRQTVTAPGARMVILEQGGVDTEAPWRGGDHPEERWSPDGRFLFLAETWPQGQFQLLSLASGSFTPLERPLRTGDVAWRPDGSAALVVTRGQASLVQPDSGRVVDLSAEFGGAFGLDQPPPSLLPTWTNDGRFVIVNDMKQGGCLVRPQPFAVTFLARQVGMGVGQLDPPPWVFPLQVPGWLRYWQDGEDYLVDETGRVIVPLGPADTPGGGWRVSPDGRWKVAFERDGQARAEAMRLPVADPP